MNKIFSLTALFFLMSLAPGLCGEKGDLFASVELLNIQCQGYTLCGPLSKEQHAYALKHLEKADSPKVYRFRDKDLNIVADLETNRVLVIFKQFEKIDQEKIRDLVGDMFMIFGDPTLSAHDEIVYWAWGSKGKISADHYKLAKEKKKKLNILATVKLSSEIKIMENSEKKNVGNAYYIISSPPLLNFFKED